MNFQRQVSRTLDEEHRANLELLGRVEQAFARAPRRAGDRSRSSRASSAASCGSIEHDVGRHFDFEERSCSRCMAEPARATSRACSPRSTTPSATWPPNCCRWRARPRPGR